MTIHDVSAPNGDVGKELYLYADYMPIRVAYISFVGIHVGVNISLIIIRYVMDRCEQSIGLHSVAKMGVKFHRHWWCFWALCSTLQKPSVANEDRYLANQWWGFAHKKLPDGKDVNDSSLMIFDIQIQVF